MDTGPFERFFERCSGLCTQMDHGPFELFALVFVKHFLGDGGIGLAWRVNSSRVVDVLRRHY